MKRVNFIFRAVLTAAMFMGALVVNAAGDFKAFEFKTGHGGIACSKLDFTENDLTLEFWVNMNVDTQFEKTIITGTMDGDKGFLVSLRYNSANENKLELRFFAKTPDKGNIAFFFPYENIVEQWAHFAFVVSSTDNKAYLYVNGAEYESLDATGGYLGNSDIALSVGKWYDDPKLFGKLADFRIWNVARTAEEIAENYNVNLEGENQGLVVNYTFSSFERGVVNAAGENNKGWCNPEASWQDFFGTETLAKMATNIAADQDALTWDTSDGTWDVEILDKATETSVYSVVDLATNTVSFDDVTGLVEDDEYIVKIRTLNNDFYSGWATYEFTYGENGSVGVNPVAVDELKLSVNNGVLIINATNSQVVDIYSIDGRLVRSVNVEEGTNAVDGLANGLYIINNQKVIIK